MKKALALILYLLLLPLALHSQRVSRNYHDCPMSEVLADLSRSTTKQRIIFIYNDLEDYSVTQYFESLTIADAIRICIGFYPIRLTNRGDSILLVECTQKSPYKLIGRLTDEKDVPVSNASITLYSASDSVLNRGVSNLNGQFTIPCEQKEAKVKFSHLAYKPISRSIYIGNIGTIRLETANIRLQNVKVTAHAQSHIETLYYKYAEHIENNVWNMKLPQFHVDTIPEKYRCAPAVVLADYSYIEYNREQEKHASLLHQRPKWIHTNHLHRIRYYINHQDAARKLSAIPFSKRNDLTDYTFHKQTVMGIRIIKPDGSVCIINTFPFFKPQVPDWQANAQSTDTIFLENLKEKDILDIFIYHNFKEIISPYRFEIPTEYPILNYEGKAVADEHINLQFRENDQIAHRTIEDNKHKSTLLYKLIDYNGQSQSHHPSTTLYARMVKDGMTGPRNAKEAGLINNPPVSQILDDDRFTAELERQKHVTSHPTGIFLGSNSRRHQTAIKEIIRSQLTTQAKADKLYAYLAEANSYQGKIKGTPAPEIFYATHFFDSFSYVLTQARIPFDFAMTTCIGSLPINQLMDVSEIVWFIRLKDGSCYFPKTGTPAREIPIEVKGRLAILKDSNQHFIL